MSPETTMARRISQGSLTMEETLQYGISLARAIKSRHERGQPAGNLHPDRIVLNGAAAALADGETTAGLTPYLAPEQVNGQPADVRSDIFVFGAILQEMVTGGRAFPAREEEDLKASILNAQAAPLIGVQPDLERLISRCLAKDPARRWQRAGALVIELKLAAARARQARQASSLEEHIAAIQSQVRVLEVKLLAQAADQSDTAVEMRRLEQTRQELDQKVAFLERTAATQSGAIECIRNAMAQTDEVIEHVVDAFDSLRIEARSESRNGEQY